MNKICILFSVFILVCGVCPQAHAAAYDKPYIGEMHKYDARYEDTFVHVARDYNLGFVEMRAANPGIDPWIPGAGTNLILPLQHILPDAPREGVVINVPEMRLYVYPKAKEGEEAPEPKSFPLGIGREGLETPQGETTVVRKKEYPSWRPTERMRKEDPELPEVVLPGAENPLGTHAVYLGWPQYAIHGTNRPFGIGRRVSSGCLRMYPEDVIKFFDLVDVGEAVRVVDQPIKTAWIDDDLYIEVHPSQDEAIQMEEEGYLPPQKISDDTIEQIIKVAGAEYKHIKWNVVYDAIAQRKGYPIKIVNLFGSKDELAAGEVLPIEDIKKEIAADLQKRYERTLAAYEAGHSVRSVAPQRRVGRLNQ